MCLPCEHYLHPSCVSVQKILQQMAVCTYKMPSQPHLFSPAYFHQVIHLLLQITDGADISQIQKQSGAKLLGWSTYRPNKKFSFLKIYPPPLPGTRDFTQSQLMFVNLKIFNGIAIRLLPVLMIVTAARCSHCRSGQFRAADKFIEVSFAFPLPNQFGFKDVICVTH